MIFTNLDRPFLGYHYYILSLSDLCLWIEKNDAFSLYDLYDDALEQEPQLPGGS